MISATGWIGHTAFIDPDTRAFKADTLEEFMQLPAGFVDNHRLTIAQNSGGRSGDVDAKDYVPLMEGLGDMVRVWAIDPDRVNIEEFMAYAKEKTPSVIFAHGHSCSTSEAIRAVAHYGVKVRTHITDSGGAKGRAQGTPGVGGDEYCLYEPDMYAELICKETGIHIVPDLIKMIVRTKGVELKEEFPNVKLIVAHVGRAYTKEDVGNAFELLDTNPNILYDFSANCCEYAITEVIKHAGVKNVMFGSDMPILRMRTHRIEENGTYINLMPPGLYGDPSQDPHLREVTAEEAEKITFFMYNNARKILDEARISIYGK